MSDTKRNSPSSPSTLRFCVDGGLWGKGGEGEGEGGGEWEKRRRGGGGRGEGMEGGGEGDLGEGGDGDLGGEEIKTPCKAKGYCNHFSLVPTSTTH